MLQRKRARVDLFGCLSENSVVDRIGGDKHEVFQRDLSIPCVNVEISRSRRTYGAVSSRGPPARTHVHMVFPDKHQPYGELICD